MRQNKLKEKISRGEVACGLMAAWPSAEAVELAGHLGFDYVVIDAEHGYIGRETCAQLVRACEIGGATPVVRVPENNSSTILGYLETGVLGVMVPHVSTVAQAEAVVSSVRYGPIGTRSISQFTRVGNYGLTHSLGEYLQWANENILVHVMIEDREGLENLGVILDIDGIDIVTYGPADLASALGYPGQLDHPDVQKTFAETDQLIRSKKPAHLRSTSISALLASGGRQFLSQG